MPAAAANEVLLIRSIAELGQALELFFELVTSRAAIAPLAVPLAGPLILRAVRQADGTLVLRSTEAGEVVASSARVTLVPLLPPPQPPPPQPGHDHAMTTRSRAAAARE